jgi:hypothetical protein
MIIWKVWPRQESTDFAIKVLGHSATALAAAILRKSRLVYTIRQGSKPSLTQLITLFANEVITRFKQPFWISETPHGRADGGTPGEDEVGADEAGATGN